MKNEKKQEEQYLEKVIKWWQERGGLLSDSVRKCNVLHEFLKWRSDAKAVRETSKQKEAEKLRSEAKLNAVATIVQVRAEKANGNAGGEHHVERVAACAGEGKA